MNPSDKTQQLLTDLGFDSTDAEQRQLVLNKLQEMVDIEILYATTSRLTDPQIGELETITNQDYPSDDEKGRAIVSKLKEFLPDYEDIVGRALDELYQRIKRDVGDVNDFLAHHPVQVNPPSNSSTGDHNP